MFAKKLLQLAFVGKNVERIYIRSTTTTNKTNQEINIVKSKIPSITIPDLLVDEYAWRNVDKWYDKTAVVCSETTRSYTYYEVHKKSKALARYLRKSLNLQTGDTLGVVLPNIPEYLIVVLGALEAGLRVTTVNSIYTSNEIHKQLVNSDCKVVFTVPDIYSTVENSIKRITQRSVTIIMIKHSKNSTIPPGVINFDNACSGETETILDKARSSDVVFLPYSSGTTGLPKGVELTHKAIVSTLHLYGAPQIRAHLDAEGTQQDIVPAFLPLFHIYGLVIVFLSMFTSGCKIITVPKFSLKVFLEVLKQKPTLLFAAPPIVLMMNNNPQIHFQHLESIRTVTSGAAPLGTSDIERFRDKTKGQIDIIQSYGSTETLTITAQTSKVKNGIKFGGVGYAIPNTECKIVCPDDIKFTGLGPNQSGEILVRGPQLMKQYHNNDKATKEAFVEGGWLRTGDIGHYDEDEHLFVTDRVKELIKVKGFQVAPAELEEIIRGHPAVEDAAVVGAPHARFGQVPKGFVVAKTGRVLKNGEIQEYVASRVTSYKRLIGGVELIDKIPKSASGKILRKQLQNN